MCRIIVFVMSILVLFLSGCCSYRVHVSTEPAAEMDVYLDGTFKGRTSPKGEAAVVSGTTCIFPFPLVEVRRENYKAFRSLSFASANEKPYNIKQQNVISTKRREEGFLREYRIRFRVPGEFATPKQNVIAGPANEAKSKAVSQATPSGVKKAWQKAEKQDTKKAFIDFVIRYRDTPYTVEVMKRLEKYASAPQDYSVSAIRPPNEKSRTISRFKITKDYGGGKLDVDGIGEYVLNPATGKFENKFWDPGAEHTILCVLSLEGYTFLSDPKNPLVFEITTERGYVHRGGRGVVIAPGGALIALKSASSSTWVVGGPEKGSEGDRMPREGAASVPGKSTMVNVIGRDGLYVAYSNGIVRDTRTGLEWVAGPDKDMNWNEAKFWVESLNTGRGGWRMPTVDELRGLYKKGSGDRNMTSLLKTSGLPVWSGETEGSSDARVFFFQFGVKAWSERIHSPKRRAFAVRSRSGSEKKPFDLSGSANAASKKTVKERQTDVGIESLLPPLQAPLKGRNEIRVKNPNDFSVVAGVRKGIAGINLHVPANGTSSVFVPDGRYDIFFVYSNRPDALFQGDSFTLNHNGVEIRIVKVVGGNYGIRQVK